MDPLVADVGEPRRLVDELEHKRSVVELERSDRQAWRLQDHFGGVLPTAPVPAFRRVKMILTSG